jgi:hypothetical protein
MFQSKNPRRILQYIDLGLITERNIICSTIETNRHYVDIMNNSPLPIMRSAFMQAIELDKYITIEPILDFDISEMVKLILKVKPKQVNIGADIGKNNLPEPSREKILQLRDILSCHTKVYLKSNLKRLLENGNKKV